MGGNLDDGFTPLPYRKDPYPDIKSRHLDINIPKLQNASAKKGFDHKHLRSISNIVGSRKSSNINELVSPYSILR